MSTVVESPVFNGFLAPNDTEPLVQVIREEHGQAYINFHYKLDGLDRFDSTGIGIPIQITDTEIEELKSMSRFEVAYYLYNSHLRPYILSFPKMLSSDGVDPLYERVAQTLFEYMMREQLSSE